LPRGNAHDKIEGKTAKKFVRWVGNSTERRGAALSVRHSVCAQSRGVDMRMLLTCVLVLSEAATASAAPVGADPVPTLVAALKSPPGDDSQGSMTDRFSATPRGFGAANALPAGKQPRRHP